ncbi:MAG TPA: 5-oxoprolinase subunit PxpA [Candidatus Limnocylindrales bacterium]|nr:5-oxoprolinase subunit PxpA [Candidatus Limnocylindrales bacterium]
MRTIDLNSDLGEGAGHDAEIMRFISSANIACGGHAGDEKTMRKTVELAVRHGVAIGAHPGYPDRANFGRIPVAMDALALIEEVSAQVRSLAAIATAAGTELRHVKAHGAMYNQAERDAAVARSVATGIFDDARGASLLVFAPPGSAMLAAASAMDLRCAREGFVDRAYEGDGTLRSRKLPGSVHSDPEHAAAQAVAFVRDGGVRAFDGTFLRLEVDTLCLHGDTPGAPAIAAAVRAALDREGITVRPVA